MHVKYVGVDWALIPSLPLLILTGSVHRIQSPLYHSVMITTFSLVKLETLATEEL